MTWNKFLVNSWSVLGEEKKIWPVIYSVSPQLLEPLQEASEVPFLALKKKYLSWEQQVLCSSALHPHQHPLWGDRRGKMWGWACPELSLGRWREPTPTAAGHKGLWEEGRTTNSFRRCRSRGESRKLVREGLAERLPCWVEVEALVSFHQSLLWCLRSV